jgi:hypothetical protein
MRRSACLTVALAALVSLLVASVGVAGASPGDDRGGVYVPVARGENPNPDQDQGSKEKADKAKKPEPCPTDLWVIALPVEGLACVLLLPKPPADEGKDGGGGGGGGGLLQ